jgi:hypothetical protein
MAEGGILACAEDLRSKPEDRTTLRRWPGRMGSERKPLKLLLKNRKSAMALPSPLGIMAEIAGLDMESAVVLGRIRGLA